MWHITSLWVGISVCIPTYMLAASMNKWLETLSAPFLIVTGLALLAWAALKVGGIGAILRQADALRPTTTHASFLGVFIPWVTATVGYWATLSLNIPDFTRYAKSQRDQALGQALGLVAMVALAIATLTTNIAANIVAPRTASRT